MPTSAYKDGALKKNPLLGTATYSVAQRADQKDRLMGLYEEAKPMAAQGRAGMEGALAGRYAKFAETDQASLGELKSKYSGLQDQSSKLLDTNKVQGYASEIEKRDKYLKKNHLTKKKRQLLSGTRDSIAAEKEAYETNAQNNYKRLQAEGNTYAAEYDRKANALQQRIDDYNLFLGMY